jgi:hypothetical protein
MGYARQASNQLDRANADFTVDGAVALMELVNAPSTFVSSNPYYVVSQVKQMKPFTLLVSGRSDEDQAVGNEGDAGGQLFQHDPTLVRQPTFTGYTGHAGYGGLPVANQAMRVVRDSCLRQHWRSLTPFRD